MKFKTLLYSLLVPIFVITYKSFFLSNNQHVNSNNANNKSNNKSNNTGNKEIIDTINQKKYVILPLNWTRTDSIEDKLQGIDESSGNFSDESYTQLYGRISSLINGPKDFLMDPRCFEDDFKIMSNKLMGYDDGTIINYLNDLESFLLQSKFYAERQSFSKEHIYSLVYDGFVQTFAEKSIDNPDFYFELVNYEPLISYIAYNKSNKSNKSENIFEQFKSDISEEILNQAGDTLFSSFNNRSSRGVEYWELSTSKINSQEIYSMLNPNSDFTENIIKTYINKLTEKLCKPYVNEKNIFDHIESLSSEFNISENRIYDLIREVENIELILILGS